MLNEVQHDMFFSVDTTCRSEPLLRTPIFFKMGEGIEGREELKFIGVRF